MLTYRHMKYLFEINVHKSESRSRQIHILLGISIYLHVTRGLSTEQSERTYIVEEYTFNHLIKFLS